MKPRFGIDIGNSRSKLLQLPDKPLARLCGNLGTWVEGLSCDYLTQGEIEERCPPGAQVEIVSVDPAVSQVLEAALTRRSVRCRSWTSATLPIANAYGDDSTLGPDRPLAAYAAYMEMMSPVIVIDSGTALTVDLVDANGLFVGGSIGPGLSTLGSALGDSGAMLHRVDAEPVPFPGRSTADCLRLGVFETFAGGLLRLVEKAQCFCPEAKIVVTGGDEAVALEILADKRAIGRPLIHMGLALLSWSREQDHV